MERLILKNRKILEMVFVLHKQLGIIFDEWIVELEHLKVFSGMEVPEVDAVHLLMKCLEEILEECNYGNIERYTLDYPENFSEEFNETILQIYKTYERILQKICNLKEGITSLIFNKKIVLNMPDCSSDMRLLSMIADEINIYLKLLTEIQIKCREINTIYGTAL